MNDVTPMHKILAFFDSQLFHDVQMAALFSDSKSFADAIPNQPIDQICQRYLAEKSHPDFDLSAFVQTHFAIPKPVEFESGQKTSDLSKYIACMWQVLEKQPDQAQADSLIPLKHPYIVPGGRFREIYYWDSYFTALGLAQAGRFQLIGHTINNFIDLQNDIGCIPNGNRAYYFSRSQPPVLALLVSLYQQCADLDDNTLTRFVDGIEQEYKFWMNGENDLASGCGAHKRVVRMPDGSLLNRYWDDVAAPRPESYREDIELAAQITPSQHADFYRNIRAACESGWDFSARWLDNPNELASINTTNIVPIDLNCLLFQVENTLARLKRQLQQFSQAQDYEHRAVRRRRAINHYMWDAQSGVFRDYNLQTDTTTKVVSLATVLPLFVELADATQAQSIVLMIQTKFLKQGGLVTTLTQSDQQWDTPNGWAPLHWFAVEGLERYGQSALAKIIRMTWVSMVTTYFDQHHHIMEKYNVCDPANVASGGEYAVQHGFGWTNGVTSVFKAREAAGT